VLEEFEKALGEMVSMRAVIQAAMCTIVTLLVLLAMPEPVTKFIAAWATAALVLWVGAQTLYNLITGWFELMKKVRWPPPSSRYARQARSSAGCSRVKQPKHLPWLPWHC
jgi:hypothetical protein